MWIVQFIVKIRRNKAHFDWPCWSILKVISCRGTIHISFHMIAMTCGQITKEFPFVSLSCALSTRSLTRKVQNGTVLVKRRINDNIRIRELDIIIHLNRSIFVNDIFNRRCYNNWYRNISMYNVFCQCICKKLLKNIPCCRFASLICIRNFSGSNL